MDFDLGGEEREAEGQVEALVAAEAAAIAAFAALDPAARRRLVCAAQRTLSGPGGAAVAPRLALARASVPLLLACEATRHLVELAGGSGLPGEERSALQRGDRIGAVASADAAGAPRARLRRDGDGWRLTARKAFVTNGPVADWIAVVAEGDEGEVLCLISPRDPGVLAGDPFPLMGLDGLAVGSLQLEETPVPGARVLGPGPAPGPAARYAREADLSLAVAAAGLMRGALREANRHAHRHARDGRPSFSRQEVAFALAEALALAEAAELLCHRAAWAVQAGDAGAAGLVRCAKIFGAESAERVASLCLQVTAGEGYRRGSAAERAYRDAKGLALAGTTVEVARMALADALLARG